VLVTTTVFSLRFLRRYSEVDAGVVASGGAQVGLPHLHHSGGYNALLGSGSRHHGLTRQPAGALRPTGNRWPRLLSHLIDCPYPPQPPDPEPATITRVDGSALRPSARCPYSEPLITAPRCLTLPLLGSAAHSCRPTDLPVSRETRDTTRSPCWGCRRRAPHSTSTPVIVGPLTLGQWDQLLLAMGEGLPALSHRISTFRLSRGIAPVRPQPSHRRSARRSPLTVRAPSATPDETELLHRSDTPLVRLPADGRSRSPLVCATPRRRGSQCSRAWSLLP